MTPLRYSMRIWILTLIGSSVKVPWPSITYRVWITLRRSRRWRPGGIWSIVSGIARIRALGAWSRFPVGTRSRFPGLRAGTWWDCFFGKICFCRLWKLCLFYPPNFLGNSEISLMRVRLLCFLNRYVYLFSRFGMIMFLTQSLLSTRRTKTGCVSLVIILFFLEVAPNSRKELPVTLNL